MMWKKKKNKKKKGNLVNDTKAWTDGVSRTLKTFLYFVSAGYLTSLSIYVIVKEP